MPTYSELAATSLRIRVSIFSVSLAGWLSCCLRPGRTGGAISAFSTSVEPHSGQAAWPARLRASNASADWNQLSKPWSLSHFKV